MPIGGTITHPRQVRALLPCKPAAAHARAAPRRSQTSLLQATASLSHVKVDSYEPLKPLPRVVENLADDPNLHNPLQRMERLNPGWCGIILELEGVVVQDTTLYHEEAWLRVAEEFGARRPLGYLMRRAEGLRDEVVITRIFSWTSIPSIVSRIAKRKQEIYEELLDGVQPMEMPGTREFLALLHKHNVPYALACAIPRPQVDSVLDHLGLQGKFNTVITAEDSSAPEVDFYYMYASQDIGRPPVRCAVAGSTNRSIEAAHNVGMKSIIVSGNKPSYDFSGADLVVRRLDQLTLMNLKNLFGNEELVEPRLQEETETETEPV